MTGVQAVLVAAAATFANLAEVSDAWTRSSLIVLLGIAMGAQNAVVRRLAVPDLKTTVLTQTVTGLIADDSETPERLRRLASVASMLVGALIGGFLLRTVEPYAPLWTAAAALAACSVAAYFAVTRRPNATTWS